MAQGIVMDITARITGYEASLKVLKEAFAKIDPGSDIGKNLKKAIEQAESQLKSLSKNLTPKVSSNNQIDNLTEKTNRAGESIQKVADLMQKVGESDINFESFDSSIKELMTRLQQLEKELNDEISAGIKNTIVNTESLSNAFKQLNIDTKDKTGVQLFEELVQKSKEAEKTVVDAAEAVEAAQQKLAQKKASLTAAESNPIANKNELSKQLKDMTKDYGTAISSLQEKVKTGLNSLLKDDSKTAEKLLNGFMGGLTPDNLKERIQTLKDTLINTLGSSLNAKEIYTQLFGDMGRGGNSQAVSTTLLTKVFPSRAQLEELKLKFTQQLSEISTSLDSRTVGKIQGLIDKGSINEALAETLKAIENAYSKVKGEIIKKKQEVIDATSDVNTAKANLKTAEDQSSAINTIVSRLTDRVGTLEKQLAEKTEEIRRLNEIISEKKTSTVNQIKNDANGAGGNVGQWKLGTEEVNRYKSAVEQVQAREKLVGKLEGVVQRWFSIYAAVRMVSNAIKSVISTVKELDKTITEIVIVTDMTQDDLWKKMSDYTDMATQYAASISGVYKVSQLYYQQGLQTADVMALTEETLKMARISGLDYAEATNYMTNAVRSFKMEMTDAQRVVDVYSEIAANSATSTAELASAMSKTASSANAVGSSFENTTAMMAVMIEATRESAENIGSALKSIISRYGEMKEDPAKLIDSEGEAMSLNKVDKALQSVGISLQDTNHQFKNFDDVITELAGKWDTIDTNTQRYIATIMAGNRQQSRFLALVSSGDRLAELSEKAANSQDAAQLQMLKTMDSIEAKTQQLKTSLQSLYTSSGIQNLFKNLLDLGNGIIQTFTRMPTTFNLPILAIIRFGTQFYALANIVGTVFGLIKNRIAITTAAIQNEELSKTRQGVAERTNAEEVGAQQNISIWRAMLAEFKAIQAEMTGEVEKATAMRAKITRDQKGGLSKQAVKGGLIASAAGGALTLASAGIEGKTQGQLVAKGALEGVGSVLQGIGTGAMIGGIPGAILGALTAIPGVISGISTAWETATERAERFKKASEEANNVYLQKHDELKTLQEQADKFEELAKAQYDSKEAREEFLELSNTIAAQHPELITAIDAEGNAIVNLSDKYFYLEKARKAAIEAAQETAMTSYEEADNAEQEARKNADKRINEYIYNARNLPVQAAQPTKLTDILAPALTASGKDLSEGELFTIFNQHAAYNDLQGFREAMRDDFGYATDDIFSKEIVDKLAAYYNSLQENSDNLNDTLSDEYAQLNNLLKQHEGTILGDAILDIIDQNQEDLKNILINDNGTLNEKNIKKLQDIRDNTEDTYTQAFIDGLIDLANEISIKSLEVAEATNNTENVIRSGIVRVVGESLTGLTSDYLEEMSKASEFINEAVYQSYDSKQDLDTFLKNVPTQVENYDKQLSEIWKNLTPNEKNNFNQLIANSGHYNLSNFQDALYNIIGYTHGLNEAIIRNLYENAYSLKNFTDAVDKLDTDFDLTQYQDILKSLGSQDLLSILDVFKNVDKQIQSKIISQNRGNELIKQYMSLFNIASGFGDDAVEANKLISGMSDFSLDGIAKFKESVENSSLSQENIDALIVLADLLKVAIPVNLNTEIETLNTKLTSGMEDFEKALSSASKGMDFKTATEVAAKMGKSITDFDERNGQYFVKSYKELQEAYLGETSDLINNLQKDIDKKKEQIKNLNNISRYNGSQFEEIIFDFSKDTTEADIQEYVRKNREFLLNRGFSGAELDNLDEELVEWQNALKQAPNDTADFLNWLADKYQKQLDDAKEGALDYANRKTAEAALTAGNFEEFVDNYVGIVSESFDKIDIKKAFNDGDVDKLLEIYPEFADTITKTFSGIATGILNKITSESSTDNYITEDSVNKGFLELLAVEYPSLIEDIIEGENGTIYKLADLTEDNINDYYAAIDASNLDSSEKAKQRANGTNKVYNESWDKYLQDIFKNSDKITQEVYENVRQKLLDAGKDVSEFEKFFTKEEGSNDYKLSDISGLITLLKSFGIRIGQATIDAGNEAVEKTTDNYLKEVSNATNLVIKGTTSQTEKQSFVDKYNDLMKEIGNTSRITMDTAFSFDINLNTDVLNNDIFNTYIEATKIKLENLELSEEQINQYIKNLTTKTLAEAVNISGYLKSDHREKATSDLESQLTKYYELIARQETQNLPDYAKKTALDSVKLRVRNTIAALNEGGAAAVEEYRKFIQESEGRDLTAEEVKEAYLSELNQYKDALSELDNGIQKGSIITNDFLRKALEDADFEIDKNGVVTTVGNMINAYHNIYNGMKDGGEATVFELNETYAKILEMEDDVDAISALGDAASMTYTRLGEILATKGIELTDEFLTQYSNAIQKLGGGKIRITNFDKFATEIMGWTDIDTSSEEYISAFKTYNDSLVDMNRKAERNIIEEVQSLENAKGGDWINLTQLYSELTKELVPEGYKGNVDLKHRPIVDFGEYYETILGTSRMDIDFSEIEGELPKIGITLASITKDGIELTEDYIDEYSVNLFDKAKEIQASGDTRALSEIIKDVDASMDNLLLDAIDGYGKTAEELSQTLDSNAEELHNRQAEWYGMLRALNNVGATIEDGILKIDEENANIPAIMSILIDSIQNSGKLATQEEAQLLDTLNDNLKQYSDLISNGIKGNLNYQGAQQLKDWAKVSGIGDLDFQKTAEGLKLSEQSAFKLYDVLKTVDELQAQLTLEELADSLESTNDNYRDMTSIMGHIAELEREINNPEVSTARREEYQRELSVAKEIAQTRSMTDKGNFNFMSGDLPDGLKNVEDFWQGTYDGFESMNKAIDKGYMSIKDFYNLANFMNDTAKITGKSVNLFGIEVGGSLNSLSDALQKGFGAIKNIDTEGPMVSLKKIGSNFASGANDMKKDYITGVKAMADGQIKVLDAMIAQLELVVAMKNLKPVDINNDNKISLDELFILKTDENGNIIGIDGLTENGSKAIQAILDAAKTNTDLANALDTYEINGKTMRKWMEDAINGDIKSIEDAKIFQATLSALYAALQTGDWSPESIKTNIIKFLQESLDRGTWAEFTLTDGTKVQVSHDGYIEQKGGKWYANGGGKSYDTVEEARDAVRFEAETGIKNAFRNENGEMQGFINIDDEHKVTVTEGINGEYKYSYKGASGETSGTKEEAIQAAYQDYHDQAIKNNDLPGANTDLEQWMIEHDIVAKFGLNITDVQATTNKTIGELSDEMLADLGIDVGLVTAVQAGIERAFLDGQGIIGNAIAAGIITALSGFTPSPQQAQNFNLPNVNAKIKNLSIIDVENITFGQTLTGNPFADFIGGMINKIFGNDGLTIDELKAKVTNLILDKPTKTNFAAVEEDQDQSNASIDTVKASVSKLELSKPTTTDFTAVEEGENNVNLKTISAGVEKLEIAKPTEINDDQVVEAVKESGSDITAGLVEGMGDGIEVSNKGSELGTAAVDAINDAAGTHSPSTITTQTGKDLVEGLVNGLSDSSSAVSAATTVAEKIIEAIQNYFNEHPITINTSVGSSGSNNENSDDSGLVAIQTAIDNISKAANTATASINTLNEKLEAISGNGATKAEDFEKALSLIGDNGKNKADEFQSALEAIKDNGKKKADEFQDSLSKIGDNGKNKADEFQDSLSKIEDNGKKKADEFQDSLSKIDDNGKNKADAFEKALSSIGDNGKNKADDFAAALDGIEQDGVNRTKDFQGAVNGIESTGVTNASSFKNAVNDTNSSGANNASDYRYAVNGTYESGATHAKNFKDALNSIDQTTLHVNVKVTTSGSPAQVSGNLNPWWSWAKGNVSSNNSNIALAGGKTLMGELGPELVVSKGRYFLVGQNGPEMVNLDNDAIVFNHLQTEKLIKNGKVNTHGQPVTNEKNATSMATGNFTGPAMASAEETLELLKQIREMWRALAKASAKDLGSMAGTQTPGTPSTTPKTPEEQAKSDRQLKAMVKEVERWYNLMRQIDNLQKEITYQEKLQQKIMSDKNKDGKALYESYKKELEYLDKVIEANEKLAKSHGEYYEQRREELNNSWYGQMLYTYDENGLQQYHTESGKGFDILNALTAKDTTTGAAKMNAQQQLNYLAGKGLNLNDLLVRADGTRIAQSVNENGQIIGNDGQVLEGDALSEALEAMMEVFWNNVDGWSNEMDGIYDRQHEDQQAVLDAEKARNEVLQKLVDNQLSLEQTVLEAVENMYQKEIDKLQAERDAYQEAVDNLINSLNESLEKERSMYEAEKDSNELEKMQRQLALLQRTGGSGSQIRSLQEQINAKQQDMYFDERQSEIDAIQEASDNEIAKLDQQIDIMSQTLEYQKEHGLLWNQVYEILGKSEAEILAFIQSNGKDWEGKSSTQVEQDLNSLKLSIETYIAQRNDEDSGKQDEEPGNQDEDEDHGEPEPQPGVKQEPEPESEPEPEPKSEPEPEPEKRDETYPEVSEEVPEIDEDMVITTDLPIDLESHGPDGEKVIIEPGKEPEPEPKPAPKPATKPESKPEPKFEPKPGAPSTYPGPGIFSGSLETMPVDGLKNMLKQLKKALSETEDKSTRNSISNMIKSIENELARRGVKAYKNGGLVDFTGPAWLDGTKSKPEMVLNAEQTKMLRDQLINNQKSHNAIVNSAEIGKSNISTNYNTNNSGVTIEKVDFSMNVAKMANELDAKTAGEKALDEMVRIARKSGNRSLARR